MTKKWKRIAALSSAMVMATATLLYFPSDTLQNISWKITANAEFVRGRNADHQRYGGDERLQY